MPRGARFLPLIWCELLLTWLTSGCDTSARAAGSESQANAACAQVDKRKQLNDRIDPAIMNAAQDMLSKPMGSGRVKRVKGKPYLFCVEPHNNRPNLANEQGFHKGVTVYGR